MSIWHCPVHGLYGGDVFCPSCGKNGDYVTFGEGPKKMISTQLLRSRLAFVRQGSETERYHTKRMLQRNDVGHHSFHVAWLAYFLAIGSEEISPSDIHHIVMAALAHDLPEHVTGDLPGDFKREAGLRGQFSAFEQDLFTGVGLDMEAKLGEAGRRIVKLADMMEGAFFCISEASLGNRRIGVVFNNFRSYIGAYAPFNEVEKEIVDYIDELWLHYSGFGKDQFYGSCPGWAKTAHTEDSMQNRDIMGESIRDPKFETQSPLIETLRREEAEGRATGSPQSNAPITGDAGVPKAPADDTVDDRATSDLAPDPSAALPANARQHGGDHYKGSGYEHWDLVLDTGMNYFQGCSTKYVTRARKHSGGARLNLLKAIHYVDKVEEAELAGRTKNNTLYSTSDINDFVAANQLNEDEKQTILAIIGGRWETARQLLQKMLEQYPATMLGEE